MNRNEEFRYGSNTEIRVVVKGGIFCIILLIYLYDESHKNYMLCSFLNNQKAHMDRRISSICLINYMPINQYRMNSHAVWLRNYSYS